MKIYELGVQLNFLLDKKCDIVTISHWAFRMYNNNDSDFNPSTNQLLECLFSMEDDPQFEYTEQQLRSIAEQWINEYTKVPDPSISLSAIPLDDSWLMCPDCIDAWESTTKDSMVDCPKCHKYFHNPRYQA